MAFDLFGTKEKQAAVEREILQKMSQLPLLDNIIKQLLGEDAEEWMTKGQSYYDNCIRTVTVQPDCFKLKWSRYYQECVKTGVYEDGIPKTEVRYKEEVLAEQSYSFTKSGYLPLHAHYNEKGKEDVSVGRVCYLWASVIREDLAAEMTNCKFNDVEHNSEAASFTYTVPALTFKDWF